MPDSPADPPEQPEQSADPPGDPSGPIDGEDPVDAPVDDLWEHHARWWIDGFTEGVDAEYTEQILPMAAEELAGAARILDVGCGDGQVSRLAWQLGAELVVGADPTWNQISVAHERGGGPAYVRAPASDLPFPDASFDAVVACLVFEHIREVDQAVAEVARVLRTGGRFCFFLNHPLLQTPNSGWIDDQFIDPPEQYWRIGPYLTEDETLEEVDKDVFIRFIHRPLSRYVNALAGVGLLVEHMAEPAPPAGFIARAEEYEHAATIPRLLYLRTRKHVLAASG
jgi:SAM-dependent methyltransferase